MHRLHEPSDLCIPSTALAERNAARTLAEDFHL